MVGEEETKLSEQLGAAKGALDAWARRQAEEVENECAAHRSSIAARRKEADALREETSALRDEAKVVGKGTSPYPRPLCIYAIAACARARWWWWSGDNTWTERVYIYIHTVLITRACQPRLVL